MVEHVPAEAIPQRVMAALVGRPWCWVIGLLAIASWPLVFAQLHPLQRPPPLLGSVPRFELTDEQGRAFGTRELAGRVWVGSWVSTDGHAERVADSLGRIQDRGRQLAPAFHLVSLTADPRRDTAARLLAFARAHHASPRLWSFLAGGSDPLRAALTSARRGASPEDAFFLVDGAGRLRGWYDPRAADVVERVLRDAAYLLNRPAEPVSAPDGGG